MQRSGVFLSGLLAEAFQKTQWREVIEILQKVSNETIDSNQEIEKVNPEMILL